KGHPLDYYVDKISGEELVIRYAKALGLLHNLPLEQGPVAQPLTHKLRLAKQNIEQQQVNTTNLQPEYAHLSLHELYEQLIRLTPTHEETVFTHGDFCLDNLFYDDALFTGYIDLDKGGLADRYQDIAIAVRTIKNELGEGMVDTFLQEYGLENLNLSKLEFYTLLDEFF
ncbi:MAG TPA: phosphotransferase, partial [Phnomibacter sp.]|nr:phosphotransferase [Phnomibacter sp.]